MCKIGQLLERITLGDPIWSSDDWALNFIHFFIFLSSDILNLEDKITFLKCFNYRSGSYFLSKQQHAISKF